MAVEDKRYTIIPVANLTSEMLGKDSVAFKDLDTQRKSTDGTKVVLEYFPLTTKEQAIAGYPLIVHSKMRTEIVKTEWRPIVEP